MDRALASSYRLSINSNHVAICSGVAAICNASICVVQEVYVISDVT